MLGWIALLVFLAGNFGLLIARIGVLDTRSLPQYAVCGIASILALAHWFRGGSRGGKIAAGSTIALSIALLFAVEVLTHYDADRPKGPEVGAVFPVERMEDATSGESIALAPAPDEHGVIVLCFRGFW